MAIERSVRIILEASGTEQTDAAIEKVERSLKGLGVTGDQALKAVGDRTDLAAGALQQMEKELEKLQRSAALDRMRTQSDAYQRAIKEAAAAQRELKSATEDVVTVQDRVSSQIAKIQQQAVFERALRESTEYQRALEELARAQGKVAQETKAVETTQDKVAKQIEKMRDQAAFERALRESAEYKDVLEELNAAQGKLLTSFDDVKSETDTVAEAIAALNEQAANDRALRGNKEYVAALKRARKESNALEAASMSLNERVAGWLENAENISGTIDLLVMAKDAVVALWDAWREGTQIKDLLASLESGLDAVGNKLQAAGPAILGEAGQGRAALRAADAGFSNVEAAQISKLAEALGRKNALLDGTDLREATAQAMQTLTDEISRGEVGPALEGLKISTAIYEEELARAAREQGVSVDALSERTRREILLSEAVIGSTSSLEQFSAQSQSSSAKFDALIEDMANRAKGITVEAVDWLSENKGKVATGLLAPSLFVAEAAYDAVAPAQLDFASIAREQIERERTKAAAKSQVREQLTGKLDGVSGENLEAVSSLLGEINAKRAEGADVGKLIKDSYASQYAALTGIKQSEADRLLSVLSAADATKLGTEALKRAVPAQIALVKGTIERQQALLDQGRLTAPQEREKARALIAQKKLELDMLEIARAEGQTLTEANALLQSESGQRALQLEQARAALEEESGRLALMTDAEQAQFRQREELLKMADAAAAFGADAADARDIFLQGVIEKSLERGNFFARALGGSLKTIDGMAQKIGLSLSDSLGPGGLLEGVGAYLMGRGKDPKIKPPGGRGKRGADTEGMKRQLRRDLIKGELEAALSDEAIAAIVEERLPSIATQIRATFGDFDFDFDLPLTIDLEAALEFQRIQSELEDAVERAGNDTEAVELIGERYAQEFERVSRDLGARLFVAGSAGAGRWVDGIASALGERFDAQAERMAQRKAALERLAEINFDHALATARTNAEIVGGPGRGYGMRALTEEEKAAARQMRALEQARADDLALFADDKLARIQIEQAYAEQIKQIERDLQVARIEEQRAAYAEQTALFGETRSEIEALIGEFSGEGVDDVAASWLTASQTALAGAEAVGGAIDEVLAQQAALAAGKKSETEAALGSTNAILGAVKGATSGIIKDGKARAGFLAAFEAARALISLAELDFLGFARHTAAAVAMGAIAGGGAGTAKSAGGGDAKRQQAQRTQLSREVTPFDRRGQGPSQIINVFGSALDGRPPGELIVEAQNRVAREGRGLQLDGSLMGSPNRLSGL